jgi:hypothetical protein
MWKRYLHFMFIAALFTIAKIWNQPKCQSTIFSTKKESNYVICDMYKPTDNYVKCNKPGTQKDKYYMSLFYVDSKTNKLIEAQNRKVASRSWEVGEGVEANQRVQCFI